jgi:hypothetical protein
MSEESRLPDFSIIGTMKCGTTSLFRWLGEQPKLRLAEIKSLVLITEDLLQPGRAEGGRFAECIRRTEPLWDHNGDGRGA